MLLEGDFVEQHFRLIDSVLCLKAEDAVTEEQEEREAEEEDEEEGDEVQSDAEEEQRESDSGKLQFRLNFIDIILELKKS